MGRWLVGASVGAGVLLLAGALASKPSNWVHDYAAAKALAKKSGKPLLVVFR